MASYNENAAYDLNRFDSSPAVKVEPKKKPQTPKILHSPRKSAEELRAEARRGNLQAIKFILVASLLFSFVGVNIYSRVQINETNRNIVALNKELNEKKSENTRLTMALNAKVSLEKVEDYAINVLGMVKRDRYQVTYFDLSEGNRIVSSAKE